MNAEDEIKIRKLYEAVDNATCHDTARPYYGVGYDRCRQEVKTTLKKLFPEVFNARG